MINEQRPKQPRIALILLLAVVAVSAQWLQGAAAAAAAHGGQAGATHSFRMRRSMDHNVMMHNHLSRKVFDRACAASKDTVDEILACVTGSDMLAKTLKDATAKHCYSEAFGDGFDPTDVTKHRELICKNREKFESMTACIYKKTGESLDPKEMEKFTESLVDVGLCIINALDG